MASRRFPETIPFRGFGVCTVQTHWSRPGAILTAYSMCRCSISSPEGCAWELVALCKYRPSAPLWRRSVHNCSSFPDRAIVLGARHATYDTCQPIGWTRGSDPHPREPWHVALCADVASSGDNHVDRCDLLHHRIIHDSARKALAGLRISASRQWRWPTRIWGGMAPDPKGRQLRPWKSAHDHWPCTQLRWPR